MGKNDEKNPPKNSSELDIEKAKLAKQKEEFEKYRNESQKALEKEYENLDERVAIAKQSIKSMQGHDGHVGQSQKCYSDSKTNAAKKVAEEAKK